MDGLPLPAWCAQAFINSIRDVWHYRKGSWDDVFTAPNPKGTNLAANRKKRENQWQVYSMVENRPEGTPIDDGLFEQIGEQLGIGGKSTTKKYYYAVKVFYKSPGQENL
jgi:hypothetical protein